MLKAFRNQLQQLALRSPEDTIARVAARVGPAKAKALAPKATALVLFVPTALDKIRGWYDQADVPEDLRRLHGVTLTYLYHPADLLPEESHGFFGYLDDAYLVGSVYEITLRRLIEKGSPVDASYIDEAPLLETQLDAVRQIVPEAAARLDALLRDYLAGDARAFRRLMDEAEARHSAETAS